MIRSIQGLQQAQRGNLKTIAAMKPGGSLEKGVRVGTLAAHRYAVALTHVDTGALRASHRVKMKRTWSGPTGTVYIDPNARNPRLMAQRTAVYGPFEHARGGEHAFYKNTSDRYGFQIGRAALAVIVRGFPK
ncbi:MAG: hypothetical protein PHQ36_05835 [Anaerolineales bacterium]|nr:hypothetical protein [Anaerolineales bacterium]